MESQKFIEYYLNSIKLDDYVSGMAQPKLNQKKLNSIRAKNPDAAGLIVASSVEHAKQIGTLMKVCFNEDAVIVTCILTSNPIT